jgi:hypothetical protein
MKQILSLILCGVLMFSVAAYSQSFGAGAGKPKSPDGIANQSIPNNISYQGLITTASGAPASDGIYSLKFDFYSDTTGGISYWNETQSNVNVQRGTFHVALGSVTPFPSYVFNSPLFVQVTALSGPGIGSSVAFAPRTPLASSAYSLNLRLPFLGSVTSSSSAFDVWNSGTGPALSGRDFSGNPTSEGVYGFSTAGNAMYGYSTTGTGISGITQTNHTDVSKFAIYGLKGNSLGLSVSTGTTILGESDSSYGVSGLSNKSGGVLGFTYDGYGVFAQSFGTGYALYSAGPLAVIGFGDASVQLPNDAINSQEMLDEPGVAAKYMNGFFFAANSTSNQTVDSVTITVPAAGKVIIQSSGYTNFSHTNGTADNISTNILTDPTANIYSPGVSSFVIPTTEPTSSGARQPFANVAIFNAASSGTYKYYLVWRQFSGASIASSTVGYTSIVATYYPTTYGATPINAPSIAGKGDGSSSTMGSVNAVSYQTAEEYKAAKTSDLNQKVQKLESQIQKLEKIIGKIAPAQKPGQ